MKRLTSFLAAALLFVGLFSTAALADGNQTTEYSDVATVVVAEDGFAKTAKEANDTGKKQAMVGFNYTIENGSIVVKSVYGFGAKEIKLPRMIAGYPLNFVTPGAFSSKAFEKVYLPDSIMMSVGELLNGDYFHSATTVMYYKNDDLSTAYEPEKGGQSPDASDLTTGADVQPTQGETMGDWTYTNYGNYAVITAYSGPTEVVKVPSHVNGIPVKSIEDGVFLLQRYGEVQIPSGVSVKGQINSLRTILQYDTDHPIVIEAKTTETDAEGNTHEVEEVIVIDDEKLTEAETQEASGESDEETGAETGTTGESQEATSGSETDGSGSTEKDNGFIWIIVVSVIGGVALLAGAIVIIKSLKKK